MSFFIGKSYAWEVKTVKSDFVLLHKGKSFSIISEGGTPKFVKTEELSSDYLKVIYYAGTAGTSAPCQIHRALVLAKKTQKVIGDFPVSSECENSELEKAKWILKDETLLVIDPQTEMTQKVALPYLQ